MPPPAEPLPPIIDLYGDMLSSIRIWLVVYHPSARDATLTVHLQDGVPSLAIPVVPAPEPLRTLTTSRS